MCSFSTAWRVSAPTLMLFKVHQYISTVAWFWFTVSWNIIFHPFTFSQCVSLHLK